MDVDTRVHGGLDAGGRVPWDFSTNANACGPCPSALTRVQAADPTTYPDPAYTALRTALASWHGVDPARIVIAASGSEFIQRITAYAARGGARRVWFPSHAYGDYAHAARLWGLSPADDPARADLVWLCDPGSPLGQPEDPTVVGALFETATPPPGRTVVVDLAYAPLRLQGAAALTPAQRDRCWQLWTPNKVLGLTGVRGAYAIAPVHAEATQRDKVRALAPSWPLGAHGVAMLAAWVDAAVQAWVVQSRATLTAWKAALVTALRQRGWRVADSVTPFVCAQPPAPLSAPALRARGVRLRDATSFGLPGWWRLSAQPPAAIAALVAVLDTLASTEGGR